MQAALDTDGFVVVPALDPADVTSLRRAFDLAHGVATEGFTQHVRLTPDVPEHHAWLRLCAHPILLAAASHVLKRAFRIGDLHGRSALPGGGLQGLHADWPARSSTAAPPPGLTALWMLDDFTARNGATRVVPGSHRAGRVVPRALAQPLGHHPAERVVTGPAGSVILFDGRLWHSGTRNDSTHPRRAGQMIVVGTDVAGYSEFRGVWGAIAPELVAARDHAS
jgi:ectoine hydroxylase-related dioxygenase (phytanoyl-CoA dioxygenase family)